MSAGTGAGEGELAIVLHTHMPYVEGFGTWPFGEEWLWEAMATSYLPLLDLLEAGAPLTVSVTPVLADQLAAPGIGERFERFVSEVRSFTHRADIEGCRAGGEEALARELERSARDYERASERHRSIGGDLLGALSPHVSWTSSSTHAVLALMATDAGARLQIQAGVDAHRSYFARPWRGGFWLPECGHAPWLDPLLEEAGVRATCVDLTDVLGRGDPGHLWPRRSAAGPLLVPIDRETMELVWSDHGYPAHGGYRDYHRRTTHDHRPWDNAGRPYDHDGARALAREHAEDFVARTRRRLSDAATWAPPDHVDPPLAVCALDTELLGHWWYEGVVWLEEVVDAARRSGLALTHLDDALDARTPLPAPEGLPVTTWGSPRDLSTWDGPAVADLAWRTRAAELSVVASGAQASARSVRSLLALQASDWAFMVTRGLAGPYPRERFAGHERALQESLRTVGSPDGEVRNLAVHATPGPLLA